MFYLNRYNHDDDHHHTLYLHFTQQLNILRQNAEKTTKIKKYVQTSRSSLIKQFVTSLRLVTTVRAFIENSCNKVMAVIFISEMLSQPADYTA